jgi:hypothetical protein
LKRGDTSAIRSIITAVLILLSSLCEFSKKVHANPTGSR